MNLNKMEEKNMNHIELTSDKSESEIGYNS